MNFAFISRHSPTPEQMELAKAEGIELIPVGDFDAFTVSPSFVVESGNRIDQVFEGAVVVHPAAALRLAGSLLIGVFENATRPCPEGKPAFFAKSFHIFYMRD